MNDYGEPSLEQVKAEFEAKLETSELSWDDDGILSTPKGKTFCDGLHHVNLTGIGEEDAILLYLTALDALEVALEEGLIDCEDPTCTWCRS
jgi:hypothetical protein